MNYVIISLFAYGILLFYLQALNYQVMRRLKVEKLFKVFCPVGRAIYFIFSAIIKNLRNLACASSECLFDYCTVEPCAMKNAQIIVYTF